MNFPSTFTSPVSGEASEVCKQRHIFNASSEDPFVDLFFTLLSSGAGKVGVSPQDRHAYYCLKQHC